MIPVKIYTDGFGMCDERPVFDENLEYIHKDELLKWAKKELSHANANIEAYPYENAYRGHREKIEELIEHIESL